MPEFPSREELLSLAWVYYQLAKGEKVTGPQARIRSSDSYMAEAQFLATFASALPTEITDEDMLADMEDDRP